MINQPDVPVVGVGASAGGVRALQRLFEAIPADTGAAFVVIVHLDPSARSELPEIIAARSKMPVKAVKGSEHLQRNCIYVIPPDRQLQITDHEVASIPFAQPRGQRAPIDLFFRSLAEQRGDGFAIILSGAGSDGAAGVRAIKENGGIVLVQSPDEAEYPSMPRSAIATEAADVVLPLKGLAERLAELIRTRQKTETSITPKQDQEELLRRILAHVRVRTGHDFSNYKRSTVFRRILRRMQVARKENLEDYAGYLRENAEEAQALLSDLLISVTTFFRDPKAFEALAKQAISDLFARNVRGGQIRVWVAGCATGEEAYSIAILLLEEASRHELRPEIQVFASDMDSRALAIAREGRYPIAVEADLSEERLRRYFTRDGEFYRVKRDLRDIVLFASHSVLKDPPFSRLDLVSCRNLLIYLERDLQQQALATLHYGMNAGGYLFLGSSESAEHPDGLFRAVDRDARIYRSTGRSTDRFPALPRLSGIGSNFDHITPPAGPPPTNARLVQATHREALEKFAPPSILVDENLRVVHLSEHAGRYMQPSAGPLTTEVMDMVRPELRFELRSALHRALERGDICLTSGVMVRFNGSAVRVYAQVRPLHPQNADKRSRGALIVFIEGEAGQPIEAETAGAGPQSSLAVDRLKEELDITQAQLRTTREESEAANEELRAANEELQSINEEYRSTAEELETSKEELQSINEELQTVNSELKLKLETVSRANSDLQNLMAATDFATLFLDPGLRIKRFTPRLAELFNITPNDAGRPITDFTHQLDYDGLAADAARVLDRLIPIEREIRSRGGGWYQVRLRPYRTVDDKIDGVVVTFMDVSERRQMEDALRTSEQSLRQETRLVELSRAPIFVWKLDTGAITQWNRGSMELYGFPQQEAIGKPKDLLLKTKVPHSSFDDVKSELARHGTWKGEVIHTAKDGRVLTIESQMEMIAADGQRLVLESTRDITQSKAWVARQELLLGELTHRVKNVLTVIQSLIHQSWRNARSPEEFIERVNGRVSALSNAHRLLVDSKWEGADLLALAQSQLATYIAESPDRLLLEGPAVMLPADIATPFGLLLHELGTNAAKYGALSGEKGIVRLGWSHFSRNREPWLRVSWHEEGGPTVKKPKATGFGTKLIIGGIPGAKVKHELRPEGVVCDIEMPLGNEGG